MVELLSSLKKESLSIAYPKKKTCQYLSTKIESYQEQTFKAYFSKTVFLTKLCPVQEKELGKGVDNFLAYSNDYDLNNFLLVFVFLMEIQARQDNTTSKFDTLQK